MEWFYDRTPDNTARFTLGPKSDDALFCFGINPSTATPERLDNTVKSVERIAQRHGFATFMMFNIYPQRATDPNDMHDTMDASLHQQNVAHIQRQLKASRHRKILAAWGTLITKRPYLKECLLDIYNASKKYHCTWYTIGRRSLKGHPHHPLYLSNAEVMQPFDIDAYMKMF